jgi:isochorismate synthase
VTELRTSPTGPFALDGEQRERLARRIERAIKQARRGGGPVAAGLTFAVDPATDPSAVAFASRRDGEPLFCFEHPAAGASGLAGLGCARAIEASGADRFGEVARAWRRFAGRAQAGSPEGPRGAGLVAVGGFAFAPAVGDGPAWAGYPAASLHVPEVAIARRDGEVHLTVTVVADPDAGADPEALLEHAVARVAELHSAPLPMVDPDPAIPARVVSSLAPSHYASAVARAVERIRAGEFQKIVLAREVEVHAGGRGRVHDAPAVIGVLREAFAECFIFCVARGDAAFIGASPELLIRREGLRASTLALAGSARRSADPAVDDHLGEQLRQSAKDRSEHAIVARRIEKSLRPHSVWVTVGEEPSVVKIANIQHLATPIRAQLTRALGTVDLLGALHPTPAVGGEPWAAAAPVIPELEGMDRGWYAAPVGWTDASEDGEFCVALRSALLRGPLARCFAGVGVVADSDPAAELAETEMKLGALLPVLAG